MKDALEGLIYMLGYVWPPLMLLVLSCLPTIGDTAAVNLRGLTACISPFYIVYCLANAHTGSIYTSTTTIIRRGGYEKGETKEA